MSGSASISLEQAILGHTLGFAQLAFPSSVYVALCSASMPPSETVRGIEAFGGGYSRMRATFALIDTPANIAANTTSIEWPTASASWGTLGFFELWDAPTGGNRLYWGPFSPPDPVTVAAGDIVRFSAGNLAVQASSGAGGTTSIGAYLPIAGGSMGGPLMLSHDPTTYLEAATKQYVDAHSGSGGGPGFLPLSGGTMLGSLTLAGNATLPLQAVPLQQVSPAILIKAFGALSDGVTNDAAALNAAIAAAIAMPLGAKIILSPGRTVIGSAITATIPAGVTITIEGMGAATSELYFSNATDGLIFTLANAAPTCGGIHLRSFSIIRAPTTPAIANTGLSISVASGSMYNGTVSLRDLIVRGTINRSSQWHNSVILAGVSGAVVDNISISGHDSTATDQGDVLLSLKGGPATNQYAATYNISNCLLVGGSAGIDVSGWVQGVFIANSTVIGQYDGIRWVGGGPFSAEEMAVTNCTLNAGHRGFLISGVNQCVLSNTTILHFNTGVAGGYAGVEINNSAYNSIVGNNIVGALTGTETGILISAAGVSPNTIAGNVTTNINGAGIWCQGNSTNNTVVGNNLTGGTGIVQDTAGNGLIGNMWNGNMAAFTPVSFAAPTGDLAVALSGAAGSNRMLVYTTGGNNSRWFVGASNTPESGSSSGSDFEIVSVADNGTTLLQVLGINRATGRLSIVPPTNAANDAAASAAGVPVGAVYRNGSVLMVRVA